MSTEYKVWIEIEQCDEDRDEYVTLDAPGAALATFDTYQDAYAYAEQLQARGGALQQAAIRAALAEAHGGDALRHAAAQALRELEDGANGYAPYTAEDPEHPHYETIRQLRAALQPTTTTTTTTTTTGA